MTSTPILPGTNFVTIPGLTVVTSAPQGKKTTLALHLVERTLEQIPDLRVLIITPHDLGAIKQNPRVTSIVHSELSQEEVLEQAERFSRNQPYALILIDEWSFTNHLRDTAWQKKVGRLVTLAQKLGTNVILTVTSPILSVTGPDLGKAFSFLQSFDREADLIVNTREGEGSCVQMQILKCRYNDSKIKKWYDILIQEATTHD